MNIQDKVVVVTGGQSGLGKAVVFELLEKGAMVAILDKAENTLPCRSDLLTFNIDVSNEHEVESAFTSIIEIYGAIHIAVNCAGIAPAKLILDREKKSMPLNDFRNVMEVNVLGSFNVCAQASAYMAMNNPEKSERGVIINTASIAAYDGQKGQCAYAASKGAIASMTLPMARDLSQHGIRVVGIAPGIMATPLMTSMPEKLQEKLTESIPHPKRMGYPEEFAALVEHIIGNMYLNGEVLRLDGALRMN